MIERIEQELFDNGITVEDTKMGIIKAVSIERGTNKRLFIDKELISDNKELRLILEHEKEHWGYPLSFYDFNTTSRAVKIRETKTARKLIKRLLPAASFNKLLKNKIYLHEMADELDLPEFFIREAYDYYKANGLIQIQEAEWEI